MRPIKFIPLLFLICLVAVSFALASCSQAPTASTSSTVDAPLRVGIAPYQELSILVNAKPLGLEDKYGTRIELLTMPWEDLLPAVASAGQTIDVGFASLADYLAKAENLNKQGEDPILYLYPAWTFHGGGLITFNPAVPDINAQTIKNPTVVKKFLGFKIGVQKNSCCHMLLWKLAHEAGMKLSDIPITDTTLNDGLLATENGSLDLAGAGMTQRTEALKRHGRVVLIMDTAGLMDPGGFVCKESVYKKRKKDIDALIKMWYDCSHYVMGDLDHHSDKCLEYLKQNASTKYTLSEFKSALSQEFIPESLSQAQEEIVDGKGKYSIAHAAKVIDEYLVETGAAKNPPPPPNIIDPSH
jgi:ABC-type nitrate/sulfonate/bicarbonate transport system substrate-binding protein